ncbi:MMPL family transporter [Cryptosporangium arvum]|uniref:Putative RND superfamily drug exporter n=1 Tax=Cryptosporangium arvum DSM 44712 TaxID=927661 RepID=A0A010ZRQ7_9ACTN|nr:MMPL family transporter [Cryptosporangium arvum]EXG81314.1 putative RND superfamily drug exporter [Cryptosporangium arvum DSM 44712]
MFARLGRFCYRRRKLVVVLWLLVFVAGIANTGRVTDRLGGGQQASESMESVLAARLLADHSEFGGRVSAVVDGAPVETLETPIADARDDLGRTDGVGRVLDPFSPQLPEQGRALFVADDRNAALIVVDLRRDLSVDAQHRIEQAIADRLHAIPGVRVTVGGPALLQREINEQTRRDTEKGELIALPLTLLAMVAIFGGAVAAGIPIVGALASIACGMLVMLGLLRLMDLDPNVLSVSTVLALGLSIDYALLMVNRFREERYAKRTVPAAIERTVASAGRTITFSALTVALSLAGLFVFPSPIFRGIGAAGVGVVLFALLAGVTLVPALLGMTSRRVGVGRHRPERPSDDGTFARLARLTRRRPLVATVLLTATLLATGLPFASVTFVNSSANLLPEGFEARRFAEITADRFPGQDAPPITVVASTSRGELALWAARLPGEYDGIARVMPPTQVTEGLASIDVVPEASGHDRIGRRLVGEIRADRPPFRIWVTGETAVLVDFLAEVRRYAPWAVTLMVVATFVLLFAMTGSLLVPIKALVMNVLSLAASFGALKLIFQDGHLHGFLGFTPTGGLEPFVPVLVFCFAFGLSMDYEVFLLARIKELRDAGMDNDRAVEIGLQRSGKIITSAALLMIIVFAGFAAGRMLAIKELGVAMAIAVAVDATVVRCLLVPATMALLGEANWWAPKPLRRLHERYGLREAPPDERQAFDGFPSTPASLR